LVPLTTKRYVSIQTLLIHPWKACAH
jgi:hypothetical protein